MLICCRHVRRLRTPFHKRRSDLDIGCYGHWWHCDMYYGIPSQVHLTWHCQWTLAFTNMLYSMFTIIYFTQQKSTCRDQEIHTHICKLDLVCFMGLNVTKLCLVTCSAPKHYPMQCWLNDEIWKSLHFSDYFVSTWLCKHDLIQNEVTLWWNTIKPSHVLMSKYSIKRKHQWSVCPNADAK